MQPAQRRAQTANGSNSASFFHVVTTKFFCIAVDLHLLPQDLALNIAMNSGSKVRIRTMGVPLILCNFNELSQGDR